MAEIILREFEEEDWSDLVRFYEEFYRPGYIFTNREFFDWNFYSPLRPDERCGQRLLVDDGKVVGVMGAVSWPLQVGGRPRMGECNVNLFLDPACRGRRLGQKLLHDVFSGYDYSLSLGYNRQTLSMYEREGEVSTSRLRRFIKVVDERAAQKLVEDAPAFGETSEEMKGRINENIKTSAAVKRAPAESRFERVTRFRGAWDATWERMRTGYGFTTWRSAEFLNWRYIDYPFPLYECFVTCSGERIDGLVSLRLESPPFGNVLRIVDLVTTKGGCRELLAHTVALARRHDAVFVDFIFQGQMDLEALADAGFFEFADEESGRAFVPMDLNPPRWRDEILFLVVFRENDPAFRQLEQGEFYFVKGDSDQDRAN